MLAAVVPRAVVQRRLALFGENPPEISVIGIATLAVASLLIARKALTGSGLLLDVGAGQTVAVFLKQDKILQVRRYNFCGDLSAGKKGETDASPGQQDSASGKGREDEAAEEACRRFCQELANTVEFLKWGGSMEDGLDRIILTGGGSLQRGLKEELARLFSLPVETVDVASMRRGNAAGRDQGSLAAGHYESGPGPGNPQTYQRTGVQLSRCKSWKAWPAGPNSAWP